MATMLRWLAPVALAAGLGMAALTPTPARAQDGYELARVVVDVADVIFRGGQPYYRYGNYGYDDRLIVVRDRYGRPVYYRQVRRDGYRDGPPYGNAYGYHRNRGRYDRDRHDNRRVTCDRYGRCVTRYYDPRYDRRHNDRYNYRYDNRYDNRYYDGYNSYNRTQRYWDGYRWRYRNY